MTGVRGERPRCAADLLLALRHGKSNSTDESITEMNEDDDTMIHESGGRGLLRVTALTGRITSAELCTPPTRHLHTIINFSGGFVLEAALHFISITNCILSKFLNLVYKLRFGAEIFLLRGENSAQAGQG